MKQTMKFAFCWVFGLLLCGRPVVLAQKHSIAIQGTQFVLNGQAFPFTGISFFNAIYNPAFNRSPAERLEWMRKFQEYGINVLRIWAQWDNRRGFVDACSTCSLYEPSGNLRTEHLKNLIGIIEGADSLGMVIELTLFSQESYHHDIRLGKVESDRAVTEIAQLLLPYRNVVIQVWNELSDRVLDHLKTIKGIDPQRLVTNSPGGAGILGDHKQNMLLDFLTPHTSRQDVGKHWEIAPQEIAYLLKKYQKPVVDDEPARNGTSSFGGPRAPTSPFDQVAQILEVWQVGGYVVYHHDMFQLGYGAPSTPPSGIPDPVFNAYHKTVLGLLGQRHRYMK